MTLKQENHGKSPKTVTDPTVDTNNKNNELYRRVALLYQDFAAPGPHGADFFQELCSEKLMLLLEELDACPDFLLSTKIADKIISRYFDLKEFKNPADPTKEKQKRWMLDMLHLVFKTTLVLYAAEEPAWLEDKDVILCKDKEEMISDHPFLAELDKPEGQKELNYLLRFLNYLRVAMPIIPASSNKHLLLKILERLEGSGMHYVTGGAMKPAVRRRMTLIEAEGNAPAVQRLNRKKGRKRHAAKGAAGHIPKRPEFNRENSLEPLLFAVTQIMSCEGSGATIEDNEEGLSTSPTETLLSSSYEHSYETSLYDYDSNDALDSLAEIPEGVGLLLPPSREVSLSISVEVEVDFENIMPVDISALPELESKSKHDSMLWNLIEAADSEFPPVEDSDFTLTADEEFDEEIQFEFMKPLATPGSLRSTSTELKTSTSVDTFLDGQILFSSIEESSEISLEISGMLSFNKTIAIGAVAVKRKGKHSFAGLRPTKLRRDHSLFSPDLST